MTAKAQKTKAKKAKVGKAKPARRRKGRPQPGSVGTLRASVKETGGESRWSRPRKRMISLRADNEVVGWLKSEGPGYQTRINRILRKVMAESKKRTG